MRTRRAARRWSAACVGALVATAGVAELATRVFVRLDALVYRDSENPALRFELEPNARGLKDGVSVQINGDGLRDRELPQEKARGEYRIVLAGDHFTFGTGVEVERAYARLLEGRLALRGRRPRTINLSHYSYGLEQKVELICSRLEKLQADYVVLQTDADDDARLPAPRFRAPWLKNWLRRRSAFLRWVSERSFLRRPKVSLGDQAAGIPAAPAAPAAGPAPSSGGDAVREALRRLKGCLDRAGVRGSVAVFPDLSAPPGTSAAFEALLKRAAGEQGFAVTDLGPALRERPVGSLLQRPNEPRLNEAGQGAAAEALARHLNKVLRTAPPARPPRKPRPRPSV